MKARGVLPGAAPARPPESDSVGAAKPAGGPDPQTKRRPGRVTGQATPYRITREVNTVTTASKPNKAEVWKTVYRELIGNALIPVGIRLHPADLSVTVQLQDDQFEDVAAALKLFGLPEGTTYKTDGKPYLWFEGEPSEFYTWGGYLNHSNSSPLLPGWEVNIYCQVRTVNFPLLPAAEVTA